MFHVNKNHYILWIIASTLITFGVVSYLNMASQINWKEPVLKHSYTFDDGTAKDVVGEAHGTVRGNAEIAHGLFITDEEGDYLELPADKIKINEYSAISLEAYVIAGKDNGRHTILSYFGNTQNEIGVDYIMQTIINKNTSGSSISCHDYKTPWETNTYTIGAPLWDDKFHHVVTTFDDKEIKFYIDGTNVAISKLTSENKDNIIKNLSNELAYLCKSGYIHDNTWDGAVDTFNIYDGILSEETIKKNAKKLKSFVEIEQKPNTHKPILKHAYTFDNGAPNDVVGGAHGNIVGNGKIIDGMFVANKQGQYIELPADKIKINQYSSITLETYIIASEGIDNRMVCYFGDTRTIGSAKNGINYMAQGVSSNESSWTGVSCKKINRPWESMIIVGENKSLQDNKYHHIVTTFDNQELIYYIDGVLIERQFNLRQKSNSITNISDKFAYLGKSGYMYEPTFMGAIDTFNIYEGVLDVQTIAKSAEEYLKEKEL